MSATLPLSTRRTPSVENQFRLYALRNRIAHHEPMVAGVRRPSVPRSAPDAYRNPRALHDDLVRVARWISPAVGDWLATWSRTPDILDHFG